jgi:alcohol dehydrogenase
MTQLCKPALALLLFSMLICACAAPDFDAPPALTDADTMDTAPERSGRITLITGDGTGPELAEAARTILRGRPDWAEQATALMTGWIQTAQAGDLAEAGEDSTRVAVVMDRGVACAQHTLAGSVVGGAQILRDIPRFIAMYREGKLPVNRLLSERLPLADINAAFDRLAEGKSVRQVVTLG